MTRIGQGIDAVTATATPVSIGGLSPYVRWHHANVVRGAGNGSVSAYAHAELGGITADQFRAIAAIQRNGRSAPGYQMLLGGYVGQEQVHFGDEALRLPAKHAGEGAVRVIRRFAAEREAGETFRAWLDRAGGASALGPVPRRGRRLRVRHVTPSKGAPW